MPQQRSILRVCWCCGYGFLARPNQVERGYGLYCKRRCDRARFGGSTEARLRAHTRQGPSCWEWTGSRSNGYGRIKVNGTLLLAHRVAWALTHGPIPDGLVIAHRCDNPACVRVDHLFVATQLENMQDMQAKGRLRPPPRRVGAQHHQAKLTEASVRLIRRLYADGGITQAMLAQRFGVSQTRISAVIRRANWAHVE